MQPKEAIVGQWLGRVLRTYPHQTAAFLEGEKDAFRNPIGHALRTGLAALLDQLLGGMEPHRVREALDTIVQIRAIEDCPPARALEFLFQLKAMLRAEVEPAEHELLCGRIDETALIAFELYLKYRERTFEARANEARRRVYVLERRLQAETGGWQERGGSR